MDGGADRLNVFQEECRLLSVALEAGHHVTMGGQHWASNSTFVSDPVGFSQGVFSSILRGVTPQHGEKENSVI